MQGTIELNIPKHLYPVADALWAVQEPEDLDAVFEQYGTDAELVHELMLLAVLDEIGETAEAQALLAQFKE